MHAGTERAVGEATARHLTWTLAERTERVRILIRYRDQKFTNGFDEVFRGDWIAIVRTPFRAPHANGVSERFVRAARSECLDWMLILNQQHLARVLDVFVTHYNQHRHLEHCLSHHPSHAAQRSRRQRANFVFSVPTVSVVWFTST